MARLADLTESTRRSAPRAPGWSSTCGSSRSRNERPSRRPISGRCWAATRPSRCRARTSWRSCAGSGPTRRRSWRRPVCASRGVAGCCRPHARCARSGLPVDALLLRGAEARIRPTDPATTGVVFHTAGGAMPTHSALPVVATLLDLAPWELPERYARTAAARLGHRSRVGGPASRQPHPGRLAGHRRCGRPAAGPGPGADLGRAPGRR